MIMDVLHLLDICGAERHRNATDRGRNSVEMKRNNFWVTMRMKMDVFSLRDIRGVNHWENA